MMIIFRIVLLIVASIILLLFNTMSSTGDLDLYGVTWESNHTYVRFNENGYVEVASEKVINGYYSGTYDIKKYNCSIYLDPMEKEEKWYSKDYTMTCDIEGKEVQIYGSILEFKEDYDTSLSILCSDSDRPKWTDNPRNTFIYGYDKSYRDFDSLN